MTSIYHPVWFFSIVLIVTFALCPVAATLSQHKELAKFQLPLMFFALSVPCITAVCMIYGSGNEGLIADFWRRLVLFKMSMPALLFILFLMPCVVLFSTWISLGFGQSAEQFLITKQMSVMRGWAIVGIVIPLLVAPLIEELGWRGYGVDSLGTYFNLFTASILFGVLWAVWHLPTFFVKGYYQNDLWKMGIGYVVNFFVSIFVVALLMNWIYYKTDRSIPALVLFHAVLNFSSMILRTDQFTKCIATALLAIIAVVVVVSDREVFFRKPVFLLQNPLTQNLQSELNRLREKHGFPGATCAYILPDGTFGEIAIGTSNLETKEAMTPRSRMLAASIGKTFVAATVLALASEGKLHLEDSLSLWLGSRDWFPRLPNHETITLKDLLTHSAGLADHVHTDNFLKIGAIGNCAPDDLIACILDKPPLFAAGEGWTYTDTGYILLGLVIEAAAGKSYYAEVQERFLMP